MHFAVVVPRAETYSDLLLHLIERADSSEDEIRHRLGDGQTRHRGRGEHALDRLLANGGRAAGDAAVRLRGRGRAASVTCGGRVTRGGSTRGVPAR